MIEYRIAIAPNSHSPKFENFQTLYQNINYSETEIHLSNPSKNRTQKQRSPFSQFKKPNINHHYPSRNQIATVKNQTKIIRNKVIQLFIF